MPDANRSPTQRDGHASRRGVRVASAAVAATPRTVTIVGAPLDLGQGRRGVDMGPSAIRYADLEERLTSFGCVVDDRGNLIAPPPDDPEASSGSMRTATSTRRRPVLRATSTACRSPRRWVSPATTSTTKN